MDVSLDRYCYDLPTKPLVGKKILVTGATGYIGGELIPELVSRGYQVRVMVRKLLVEYKERWPKSEIVVADALNYAELDNALKGIDYAYYLIHSLHLLNNFTEIDSLAANNFRKAAEANRVNRIIYLGSLGNSEIALSDHLKSRLQVAEDLQKGITPVTFLRAAIIIGSGSASYKMIRHLVKNCPIFLFPTWANAKCQPIAIRDVIKYLVGCLENEETKGRTFDIGGQDILSYQMMLKIQAKVVNKKRIFINFMFSPMNVYARFTSILTPISYNLVQALMESCNNDVICLTNEITEIIPFYPLNYKEALERALTRESQKMIFHKKREISNQLITKKRNGTLNKPPNKSKGILSDIRHFILHKPEIPTVINYNTMAEREDYSFRILQRLDVEVSSYKILNIHKIGIDAPAKYVFEELLQWDGDSTCWPNYIAKIVKQENQLEKLFVYLFGWSNFPEWFKNTLLGKSFIPLFKLNAIKILKLPNSTGSDNARFMLYKCSGGYPIGIFTMYVRSSIANQEETEQSQLFLMVGFNFYGKEKITKMNIFNKTWESIHDRVTSNILNRIKHLSEWRFEKIQQGDRPISTPSNGVRQYSKGGNRESDV